MFYTLEQKRGGKSNKECIETFFRIRWHKDNINKLPKGKMNWIKLVANLNKSEFTFISVTEKSQSSVAFLDRG